MKMSIIIAMLAVAFLVGCTSKASEDYNPARDPGSSDENDELYYNYLLLKYYYVYSDAELKEYGSYEGMGSGEAYGDVLAMYGTLKDPFTRYFTPQQAADVYNYYTTSGSGALIGIEMQVDSAGSSDTIVIKRVYPGSPAEAAGLAKGDKILAVNDVPVTGTGALSLFQANSAGDAGTKVKLTIQRGGQTQEISVIKAEMSIPTVFLDSLDGVPVIQITEFSEKTSDTAGTQSEFHKVLGKLADTKSAVIDLRGNPGGSVPHCLAMSDELIPDGIMIREVEHYYDDKMSKAVIDTNVSTATSGGLGEGIQWIFLADSGSASCSEIMLSAVQTRLGSTIVGDTSYGKGIGQYVMWTNAEGLAVITAIQFFNDKWDSYHHKGIIPSVLISDPDSALAYAVNLAKQKAGGLTKRTTTIQVGASTRELTARLSFRRLDSETAAGGAWKWRESIRVEP